ncbi:hypothetical protein TSAR_017066 [Trichomalopsis sarcophagae]|uniref:Mutator-like transposase domain-containing protein n=1 Tax=Trichomalopsis sarcophagae TaxID=543379 RepID=A0A232EHF0_9HYME|nr:hypothetical protein TSAR_017066 [Trichomalopsis sarcophagae]
MQLLLKYVISESRVADKFMSEAIDEELRLTRTNSQNEIYEPESVNPEDISQLSIEDLDGVQGDGTWQRRGHISYNGVFTILGQESGKIIDLEVLSSYCLWIHGSEGTKEWEIWYSAYLPSCTKNHWGSSGSMESSAIVDIFSRSIEKYNVKYMSYLGDGDSSTFSNIINSKPYGTHVTISQKECCDHVQKRFGTQLRNLKKNKKLGGKGKLTDNIIDTLQTYYDNAIREHRDSIEDMTRAIWYMHCPGSNSCCKYQKAVAEGKQDAYVHPQTLPEEIFNEIKVVFEKLSEPELLRKCLGGKTQNANESFNNVLWNIAPKTDFVGLETLQISAFLACIMFSSGWKGLLYLMSELNIKPGKNALFVAEDCYAFQLLMMVHIINSRQYIV